MPSIKDVAEMAGVSISTVSNVIRGTKYVSPELRTRIQGAIQQLGYEVNPIASGLKSRSTMTIGVVITNIHRIFFPQLIRGIQELCTRHGFNLVYYDSADRLDKEQQYVRQLKHSWVDAIILDSVAPEHERTYLKELSEIEHRRKRVPVISLERRLTAQGISSVVVDNRLGGRLATRHLLEMGCRKPAFISGPMDSCMVRDRFAGFREELERDGLDFADQRMGLGDFSPQSGYQAMSSLLARGVEIDGLFAANDQMAIGALKALKERGLRVPDDIRMVGFDNTFVASIVEPSLTTIHVPKYRMGQEAARLALEAVAARGEVEEHRPQLVELPVDLIVRRSTSPEGEQNWDLFGW